MKINIEILDSAFVYDVKMIDELNTKKLVPKMIQRRRLTRAAKIVIFLADMIGVSRERIVYGSSFGEIPATTDILKSIKNNQSISPTSFQNSVYNTAVSYLSILTSNQSEIMTISSGDNTSGQILKLGAIKALDGDTIVLLGTETFDIPNVEEINSCKDFLECGVALKIKVTNSTPTLKIEGKELKNIPNSMQTMLKIAKKYDKQKRNIIEVEV
ncbi:MAG: beta-ketoacyl synthase chain length factor [Campylobacterales bacterium]